MMETISYLTELSWLSLLLIIGILISIISLKIKISDILLLIIAGILIGQIGLIDFNINFLAGLAIFTLIMIVFESSSKFKIREVYLLSPSAIKLAFIFLVVCLLFLTPVLLLIFGWPFTLKTILLSALFAALMSGTSPSSVLSLLKEKKKKALEILELESIINTPLTIIVPIMVLDLYRGTLQAGQLLTTFSKNIATGIGVGLVIGFMIYGIMKRYYIESLSPLIVIASALVTYTLAENIEGSGVLAVTTLGIIFGWTTVKEKIKLEEFSKIFTNFLKIVVFILLGILIKIPFKDTSFLLNSLIIFLIYLVIRYIAVKLSFRNTKITNKEKIFMTLNVSKGLAVAVVAFILASIIENTSGFTATAILNMRTILDLSFLFILYSILLASIVERFEGFFIKTTTFKEIK